MRNEEFTIEEQIQQLEARMERERACMSSLGEANREAYRRLCHLQDQVDLLHAQETTRNVKAAERLRSSLVRVLGDISYVGVDPYYTQMEATRGNFKFKVDIDSNVSLHLQLDRIPTGSTRKKILRGWAGIIEATSRSCA